MVAAMLLFLASWLDPSTLGKNNEGTADSVPATSHGSSSPPHSDLIRESPKEKDKKTQEPCGEFLKRWQLWNHQDEAWEPADPSTFKPEEQSNIVGNFYFHVIERFKTSYTAPSVFLSDFSDILRPLLRNVIGGNFYLKRHPTGPDEFFQHLKVLRRCLTAAHRASSIASWSNLTQEDKDMLEKFGHSFDDGVTRGDTNKYLGELTKQLEYLLQFVEKAFKPTAERLELAISHGRMSYDLLRFYFLPGDEILTHDQDGKGESDGLEVSFVLTRRFGMIDPKLGDIFVLKGYGWEWNGTEYKKYELVRAIRKFSETMNLEDLSCSKLTDEKKAALHSRGQLFAALSGIHHRKYHGSRVIIDRRAYDNQGGYILNANVKIPEADQSKYHLFPPHVYGFNLVSKAWMPFNLVQLEEVVYDEDAWDHLVLEQKTKDLIKGLVEVSRNSNSSGKIISDVISGKGGGLISVLHGPPGTGKTLTAEGVAELLRRPLYTVGAMELSLKPSEMEKNLRGVLSLATAWDAVLLIDEADVFLEARSLHDLDRNALVSVALRLLEYHKGVLFLTTNRISTFDDAFLSRFSLTIKYPPLDKSRRRSVWERFFALAAKENASRIKTGITDQDLEYFAEKNLNGRTVKNLVRTAQTLAMSQKEDLTAEHVKMVLEIQESFLTEFAHNQASTSELAIAKGGMLSSRVG